MTPARRQGQSSAFSLVELLLTMAILSVLVLLLASLLGGVTRAWVVGEQQVETFQDGRAILDLMSQDAAQALISPKLQWVQNASLPPTANQRANSSNLFWQAALTSTGSGNICEVGYFLSQDNQNNFRLMRFLVPPTDATNYQIFANPPSDNSALWTGSVATPALNTTISDDVVAFWVRCFDSNGDPIPWLSSAAPLQFNSAARFQPAISSLPSSFKYTGSSTAQAHLLPSFVEFTIITVDSKTLSRTRAAIPVMPSGVPTGYADQPPAGFGPEDIPNAIDWFNRELIANNIKNARTFSTRVSVKAPGL